ncbi:MAG: LysR family transcriptional regulator [Solobacterium sp.]|nr:LysR family transcriptional regulator [Solobacterium sp.]
MDTLLMTADEVAKEMNVSKAYAYKVIQRMNAELVEMGYYTVSGKVNRKYFMKKVDYCDVKEKK